MQAHSVAINNFSTDEFGGQKPLTYWNDLACETFTGVVVESPDPQNFAANMRCVSSGDLQMANPRPSESVVRHTKEHACNDASGALFLHLQLGGRSLNRQIGREALLDVGDFAIVSTEEPYSVQLNGHTSLLTVRIPGERFRQQVVNPGAFLCSAISGKSGVGRVVSGFLQTLWEEAIRGEIDTIPQGMVETLIDMVALTCSNEDEDRLLSQTAKDRRRHEVFDYIQGHIEDPGLCVGDVALALGVSPRYIQKVVAESGQTVSRSILSIRLNGCAQWLSDSRRVSVSVTDIAMHWGFGDLSYFNRTFKRRFHLTPTEFRRRNTSLFN